MSTPDAIPKPQRILVRGVNWLGDAIMTTPALQRLREAQPQAHITLLTAAKLADLWRGHPCVDELLAFEAHEGIFSIGRRLREGRFDLGLALPNSHRSAMELWLARIPERVGYGAPGRNWLLTRRVAPRTGIVKMRKRTLPEIQKLISNGGIRQPEYVWRDHQLHHYLHLAAALGGNPEPCAPRLEVSAEEITAALKHHGITNDRPLLGLNAGAEYGPAKRWPVERFVAAAKDISQRTGCRWILFGGKADVEQAGSISAALGNQVVNVAGKTSLRQLCALLKACRVLLTNDTGPMHVAAAVGTPVVVPFGSTSPELTGPGLPGASQNRFVKSNAPCSPCFLRECPIDFRCMQGIAVERVVGEVVDVVKW